MSPARDPAATRQCTGMFVTQSNRHNAAAQTNNSNRLHAIGRGAVANSAVGVPSPARDPAATRQRTGMFPTQSNRHNAAAQTSNSHRLVVERYRGTVANLAVVVVSPARDPAASRQRAGMFPAQSNRHNAAAQTSNSNRLHAIGILVPDSGSVANLDPAVLSPARDPAATRQRTGMFVTQSNPHKAAAQTNNSHRLHAIDRGAVANLAVVVISPARDPAATRQRTGMLRATINNDNAAAQTNNSNRLVAIGRGAVSNLAVGVPSPARDPAATRQCTGMFLTIGA